MDLGATICLARVPRCDACPLAAECPSRGIRDEPARKQGPFEGSFRQRRAATLRLVADRRSALGELDDEAVRSLERDGLVVVEDGDCVALAARGDPGRPYRTGQLTTIGIALIVTSPARCARANGGRGAQDTHVSRRPSTSPCAPPRAACSPSGRERCR